MRKSRYYEKRRLVFDVLQSNTFFVFVERKYHPANFVTQERKELGKNLEKAAEEHFQQKCEKWIDGRYVVSLPWDTRPSSLPTCRNLAEIVEKIVANSLKKTGNQEAYEGVFSEWLQEGVIEEVKNYFNYKSDHYLPHRAVL
ncbi:hypothetical protein TNIN_60621 [Trichonephila inaurata madagascariensis]|uniref:Uncharacterized protein n=1 Tax=Trichonephila inaurata madagascariensis TaxID=2747483 RepID=A0A8X7CN47_9ARAC|nr:hypothetical protein TNIN_60621 [Trichonephila inaurata madagascariensis]